jgi:hypothetical protein
MLSPEQKRVNGWHQAAVTLLVSVAIVSFIEGQALDSVMRFRDERSWDRQCRPLNATLCAQQIVCGWEDNECGVRTHPARNTMIACLCILGVVMLVGVGASLMGNSMGTLWLQSSFASITYVCLFVAWAYDSDTGLIFAFLGMLLGLLVHSFFVDTIRARLRYRTDWPDETAPPTSQVVVTDVPEQREEFELSDV